MTRFDTIEAYHLRLRLNEAIESMRVEEKRETLNDERLYFDLSLDRNNATYNLIISFWPRMSYSGGSALRAQRLIKLPEVIYKPMFVQLWYPLSLGEYPMSEFGQNSDEYPHGLAALAAYLPTQVDMKHWEAAGK
jgi:hypothetical protein